MWRFTKAVSLRIILISMALTGVSAAESAQGSTNAAVADIPTYAPSVTARSGAAGVDVVYRASKGNTVLRTFTGGVWSAPTDLGGKLIGGPATTYADTTLQVLGRGTDGQLWQRVRTAGVWGSWAKVGGLVMSSAPAAVGRSDGRVDVFVRDAADALAMRTYRPGSGWGTWTSLGGVLYSAPAVVATDSGGLQVFVTGKDSAVWTKTLTDSSSSAWQSLGGSTHSAPAAVVPSAGRVTLFVRDAASNTLQTNTYTDSWSGWQSLGGLLIDGPGASVAGDSVSVVARGRDGALWSRTGHEATWSAWARAWVPGSQPAIPSSLLGKNVTKIPTTSKVVALTFDSAWSAAGAESIRATLQRENAMASFFLVGDFTRLFPAEANLLATSGFRIGNHSDNHPDFTTITDATARTEIGNAQTAIFYTNGAEPRALFRFPYGAYTASDVTLANGLGYVPVGWTVDSLGWQGTSGGMTVTKVVDRVLAAAQPGEIVLMHVGANPDDGTTLDAAALPSIISGLRDRGYSFVTLDALLP
ncbi:polysaccharide deacetylase family protein [Actinomadura scrupuli]|uniref:polysaccharide deacetylase family protein n=1 Tax=Actinomadura scrupuli TaxID=559629 RepID=UPI003D976CA4